MSSGPPPKPPKPPKPTSSSLASAEAMLARFGHNLVQPPIAGFAASGNSKAVSLTATRDPNRRVVFVSVENKPGAMPTLKAVQVPEPFRDGNNIFAVLLGSPKGVRLPDCGLERVGVDFSDTVLRNGLQGGAVVADHIEVGKLPGAGWVSEDRKPNGDTRIAILAPTSFEKNTGSGEVSFGDWEMTVTALAQISALPDDFSAWTPKKVYEVARRTGLLKQPAQEDYLGLWPIVVVCSTVREDREEGAVFVG